MERRDRRDAEQHWRHLDTSTAALSRSTSASSAKHNDSDTGGSGDERRAASYYDEHWGTALRHLRVEPQSHPHHHQLHHHQQHDSNSNQDRHSSYDSSDRLLRRDPYSSDRAMSRSFALTHEHAGQQHQQQEQDDDAQEQVATLRDPDAAPGVSKSSLSFILDDGDDGDSTNFSQSSAPSSVVSGTLYERVRRRPPRRYL